MTKNHDYNTPKEGATDWHVPLNENFEKLDGDVEIRDTDDKRSEYEPRAGAKFLATDTENEYLGDGSEWKRLATSGKSPAFDSVETGELRHTADSDGTRRKLLDTVRNSEQIDYDSGKLPKFDAYEVNFSIDGGLDCKVNDVNSNQRYEYVTKRSGRLADSLTDDSGSVSGIRRETSSSWEVLSGTGSGTLLVHGPNVNEKDSHFLKTTATVTTTHGPENTVLESGVVESENPVRRLRLSGGSGKLNVYGVDYVR
ncbi:hypothetical protein [Halorussus lipolyticus]|uniref:hypothetical protein n=1 Tax=Halorussus lipolyticus TaxID=3034024 RepID=UPI0023E89F49|nr:hypothetical protein [Halorussus sp. DT80]